MILGLVFELFYQVCVPTNKLIQTYSFQIIYCFCFSLIIYLDSLLVISYNSMYTNTRNYITASGNH
jgi:hypothetical protein